MTLRDQLFHAANITRLGRDLQRAHAAFDADAFARACLARLPELALKARIAWISACLRAQLPAAYPQALRIILRALPPPLDPAKTDDDFGEFIHAPYAHFVAAHGCSAAHLDISLAALRDITKRFSAEFAIRPFLTAFPRETLAAVRAWCADDNYHVRRLCSEGTRPRLPWAEAAHLQPHDTLPLLDALHADRTRYVTRSVANHLNDLSKGHPDLVIATLQRWRAAGRQQAAELDYMTRHALRTLVKQGHAGALALLGADADAGITLSGLAAGKRVDIGGALQFSFALHAGHDARVIVDYAITFINRAGARGARKVYKLGVAQLTAGQPARFAKTHPLRAGMTTRPLYPGTHTLEVQVNGRVAARASFMLRAA